MFKSIVNFKVYREGIHGNGEKLARDLSSIRKENYDLIMAVSSPQLYLASKYKGIIAQHVDPFESGAHTGAIIIEELLNMGVNGSLLNHSERKVPMNHITRCIEEGEEKGFTLYICSESLEETRFLCEAGAKYIAYEPPELIGGNISVSAAKPEIVRESAELCKSYNSVLLVGAGVKRGEDVIACKNLGAQGILVSSGVVKSERPVDALNSLMI